MFKAVGSKQTLLEIANEVVSEKITNTYVAMDRDFDILKNIDIKGKGIFYTYGYSWENDVWQIDIVYDVLNAFCGNKCVFEETKKDIEKLYKEFLKDIFCCVSTDAFLFMKDISFWDRKNHLKYLKFGKKIKPKVNLEIISSSFCGLNLNESNIEKFGTENNLHAQKDCFGHLISDYCYWLFVYLLNKLNKFPPIAKHYFNCVGIDKFILKLSNNKYPEIYNHYQLTFSSIT